MSHRPRVGFWTPILYRAGGTETWHETLLSHLHPDRVELVGLAVEKPDEFDPVMAAKIRRVCPVEAGPEAMTSLALRCDVLVFWGLAQPAKYLPSGERRPFVIGVSHGDGSSAFSRDVMRLANPDVDAFVAVSRAALGGIPELRREAAVIIPNGIDPSRLEPKIDRAEQRRRWGVREDAKVLGYLGRISEEKNYRALAEAVRWLPPPWVGVLVGDGTEMRDAQAHAFARASTRVYFPGCVVPSEVGSALHAFDVLLVPSHEEGFGQSIAEGWLAGVPVVSTPVGIARDHPEWIWALPPNPEGPEIAREVQWADRQRHALPRIADEAAEYYGAAIMARRWEALLCGARKCVPI